MLSESVSEGAAVANTKTDLTETFDVCDGNGHRVTIDPFTTYIQGFAGGKQRWTATTHHYAPQAGDPVSHVGQVLAVDGYVNPFTRW